MDRNGRLEPCAFLSAVKEGQYEDAVNEANDLAYEKSGVWAVPAYRMDGRRLDSIEDIGVTKAQLEAFLKA
jgi:nitrogen fixation-related uncharacterized protein